MKGSRAILKFMEQWHFQDGDLAWLKLGRWITKGYGRLGFNMGGHADTLEKGMFSTAEVR